MVYAIVIISCVMVCGLIIIVWLRPWKKLSAKYKGPWGIEGQVDASGGGDPAKRGVSIKNADSAQGGIRAIDETGAGVTMESVRAKKDIDARAASGGSDLPPK